MASELFDYNPVPEKEADVDSQLAELVAEVEVEAQAEAEMAELGIDLNGTGLEDYSDSDLNEAERNIDENEPNITKEEINQMFGENWDGTFPDCTLYVEQATQKLVAELAYLGNLSSIISGPSSIIQNIATRNLMLGEIQAQMNQIQGNFQSLTNTFSNFKDFGFSGGSGDLAYITTNALDNVENLVKSSITVENEINDIVKKLESIDVEKAISEYKENIEGFFNENMQKLTDMFSTENLSNLLSKLPENIISKFINLDAVQNLFLLPKQVYNMIPPIIISVKSIKAPTNRVELIQTLRQLKQLVSQMKNVQNQLEQGKNILDGLRNSIRNGDYIGVFTNAVGHCKFIEKPTQYAAKYPFNQAYRTVGGHIFETDNTPDKERLHVQHKTGTDVEVSPKGDVVAKVKQDFQTVVESNMESHVKKNLTFVVDKTAEVQTDTLNLVATSDINLTTPLASFSPDKIIIMTKSGSIASSGTLSFTAGTNTSVSSVGPMYLTSDTSIIIDAPVVKIGNGMAALISLNSSGKIQELSGSHDITSGFIKASGGLITLN